MKKSILTAIGALTALSSMANIYTFQFDGTEDQFGLTRQTASKETELEFVKEITFAEAGVNVSFKAEGTGGGFALVNAGGTNAGIAISQRVATEITMTVPDGKIKSAMLKMSGYALNALDVTFNETPVSAESGKDYGYTWTWKSEDAPETITLSWPVTYGLRYIHSIELDYVEDLGDKEECGLEFSERSVEVVLGREFTAPELLNPNQLPITWSSSDEAVATVSADGKITAVGAGSALITASTEGNDSFAAGYARYELIVIPVAKSFPEMVEMAPEFGNKVCADFPMTVTFGKGSFAYVIDGEGNASCIEDIRNQDSSSGTDQGGTTTLYKVGDVIPAGWVAVNANSYDSQLWQGVPDKVTETAEVVYPVVESVSVTDNNRVVIIEDVTFTTRTPAGNTKATGTLPNGNSYEFQDTYDIDSKPAGTYTVTCVVRYAKRGSTTFFWLAPIKYEDMSGVSEIGTDASSVRYFNLQGQEIATPENGIYVKVSAGKSTKVVVK